MEYPDSIILATEAGLNSAMNIDKEIYKLNERKAKYFKEIDGAATGTDIFHCIQLAHKHASNFWERVYGYRCLEDDREAVMFTAATGTKYISVKFYEIDEKEGYAFEKHLDRKALIKMWFDDDRREEILIEALTAVYAKKITKQNKEEIYKDLENNKWPMCVRTKWPGVIWTIYDKKTFLRY